MHVVRVGKVEKGKTYESVLVRQSYREGPRVKKRTLTSLTALPPAAIDAVERVLNGETLVPVDQALRVERSRPHGHVAAVMGTAQKLGLAALADRKPSRRRDLVMAMIAALGYLTAIPTPHAASSATMNAKSHTKNRLSTSTSSGPAPDRLGAPPGAPSTSSVESPGDCPCLAI